MTSNFRHLLAATGIAAAGTTSPALAIDPFFPDFGNDGINVLHYDISLDVEPAAGTIAGKAVITLRAPRTLDRFALDLHALSESPVDVDYYRHGGILNTVLRNIPKSNSLRSC